MTVGCRTFVPAAFLSFFFLLQSATAQRPADAHQGFLQRGTIEPRAAAFVSQCLGTRTLPRPVSLYSQGAWFVTPDLADHVKLEGNSDDGTAQVWELDGKPRAISMWVHDDEFDRSTLACLRPDGTVTRQVNGYMPGLSEPDLHWVYVHTFVLKPGGQYASAGKYTGWNGEPIAAPKLTSEDRDFIAGERQYRQWNEFDFADKLKQGSTRR